jgi:hypothetical protein
MVLGDVVSHREQAISTQSSSNNLIGITSARFASSLQREAE